MKNFLKDILLFIAFAAIFYIIAIPVWRSGMPARFSPNINYLLGAYGHMFSRMDDLKTTDDIDILFLGSSHAYRGFDTRIFSKNSINTFNLGSSSQTPIQSNMLLNRYLDHIDPEVIIFEVFPFSFDSDGVESSLDIIANDKNDLHSFLMALEVGHVKTWNTLIYATYRDIFNLDASFSEPIERGKDIYVKGGYVEKDLAYYSPDSFPQQEIIINRKQLRQFEYMVTQTKDNDIKLVLVYAPIPRENYLSYTNNQYFDSLMTSYGDYYNFNDILTLDDSLHFYDSHHLNQNGVVIFNEKLIDILKSGLE